MWTDKCFQVYRISVDVVNLASEVDLVSSVSSPKLHVAAHVWDILHNKWDLE